MIKLGTRIILSTLLRVAAENISIDMIYTSPMPHMEIKLHQ